jgi:diacylglycerol O-acyltransferase
MTWERLTGGDLAMLWPDDLGWPQDIGVLAILDGEALSDQSDFPIGYIREKIASRLQLVPRFRQRLHRPGFGQGRPYWADDPLFDIARHVRFRDLPSPGDETQLLEACEQLRRQRFDMSHPLWEFWFLNGLADGQVGLFIKVHHAVADGAAGLATLGAFLDLAPDRSVGASIDWIPGRAPTRTELVRDSLAGGSTRLRHALASLLDPVSLLSRVRRALSAIRQILAETRAPQTSLNHPIGDRRRLAVIRSELEVFKEAAHIAGGTVNDVLLNVVAGGVRSLLSGRGEPIEDLMPRAVVPMAGGLNSESGNNTASGILVPLPVGEPDVHRRMQTIAVDTAQRKKSPLSYDEAGILNSPLMTRISARLARRQRVSNIYVANLPGPPEHLYFGPARILELFPLVPLVGNTTVGVGALSYAGQFNITIVVDYDACPDVDVFVEVLRDTLNQLKITATKTL